MYVYGTVTMINVMEALSILLIVAKKKMVNRR